VRSRSSRFWAIADLFRTRTKLWEPTHAGYELVRSVQGADLSWIVRLKVHVAPASTRPRSGHLFKATVTWWPATARPLTSPIILSKRTGWFAAISRAMHTAGYRGGWAPSPQGTYADFFKDLTTVGQVRREARRLEKIDVTGTRIAQTKTASRSRSARSPVG
jgi:hypothetical protein